MNYKLDNVQLHDPELYNLIRREEHRQETTLEMIASESIQSPQLLEINACAFNNKTVVGALGDQ
ncbi:MAG: serine hydroxymethyltransferase, partial [Lachnospiraceae bacterium]|nr:serine hydroxymethyltransferase [Lachnospiraceae bacterium]